jgi:hypothetical protein
MGTSMGAAVVEKGVVKAMHGLHKKTRRLV